MKQNPQCFTLELLSLEYTVIKKTLQPLLTQSFDWPQFNNKLQISFDAKKKNVEVLIN